MTTRNKIEFKAAVLGNIYNGNFTSYSLVSGYRLNNGLAVSHELTRDELGNHYYKPSSWVIYHVDTGLVVKSGNGFKTPAIALHACKIKRPGGLYAVLKQKDFSELVQDVPEVAMPTIGKLKAMPKPKADKVHGLNAAKNTALLRLISDIDAAKSQAYRTSGQFMPFTFGKMTFRVSASLEALNRFRERVLKNKRVFSDAAINA